MAKKGDVVYSVVMGDESVILLSFSADLSEVCGASDVTEGTTPSLLEKCLVMFKCVEELLYVAISFMVLVGFVVGPVLCILRVAVAVSLMSVWF